MVGVTQTVQVDYALARQAFNQVAALATAVELARDLPREAASTRALAPLVAEWDRSVASFGSTGPLTTMLGDEDVGDDDPPINPEMAARFWADRFRAEDEPLAQLEARVVRLHRTLAALQARAAQDPERASRWLRGATAFGQRLLRALNERIAAVRRQRGALAVRVGRQMVAASNAAGWALRTAGTAAMVFGFGGLGGLLLIGIAVLAFMRKGK